MRLTEEPPPLSALVMLSGFAEADLKVPIERVVMACSASLAVSHSNGTKSACARPIRCARHVLHMRRGDRRAKGRRAGRLDAWAGGTHMAGVKPPSHRLPCGAAWGNDQPQNRPRVVKHVLFRFMPHGLLKRVKLSRPSSDSSAVDAAADHAREQTIASVARLQRWVGGNVREDPPPTAF